LPPPPPPPSPRPQGVCKGEEVESTCWGEFDSSSDHDEDGDGEDGDGCYIDGGICDADYSRVCMCAVCSVRTLSKAPACATIEVNSRKLQLSTPLPPPPRPISTNTTGTITHRTATDGTTSTEIATPSSSSLGSLIGSFVDAAVERVEDVIDEWKEGDAVQLEEYHLKAPAGSGWEALIAAEVVQALNHVHANRSAAFTAIHGAGQYCQSTGAAGASSRSVSQPQGAPSAPAAGWHPNPFIS
jgi:hypothetical protein